jgi:hypothetical protein
MPDNGFVYPPLKRNQTRLVGILRGSFTDPVKCDLVVIDIEDLRAVSTP